MNYLCLGITSSIIKGRTIPKERSQFTLLWDGLSQQVLDPGQATTDVPLRIADRSARATSPTLPQAA